VAGKKKDGQDAQMALEQETAGMAQEKQSAEPALGKQPSDPAQEKRAAELAALTYEEALARLEQTVSKLESGAMPLEDSLTAFDEGIGLIRLLPARLDGMEQRILRLTENGETVPVPLEDV
jgi:exodeoxyribonuclease VII small subunit